MSLESGKIESVNEAWKVFDDFLTMAKMKTADLEIMGNHSCDIVRFKECLSHATALNNADRPGNSEDS